MSARYTLQDCTLQLPVPAEVYTVFLRIQNTLRILKHPQNSEHSQNYEHSQNSESSQNSEHSKKRRKKNSSECISEISILLVQQHAENLQKNSKKNSEILQNTYEILQKTYKTFSKDMKTYRKPMEVTNVWEMSGKCPENSRKYPSLSIIRSVDGTLF